MCKIQNFIQQSPFKPATQNEFYTYRSLSWAFFLHGESQNVETLVKNNPYAIWKIEITN